MSVFQEETEMKWKRIALCLAAALKWFDLAKAQGYQP